MIHEDGTVRIQIVRDQDTLIWKILDVLERTYGEIALINTSFNGRGEPIVETVDEARISAQKNKIDCLFIAGKSELVSCTSS